MPIEDRIEQLARLALVIVLIATLGSFGRAKTHGMTQAAGCRTTGDAPRAARQGDVPRRQVRLSGVPACGSLS
jgi:hypothetical protein